MQSKSRISAFSRRAVPLAALAASSIGLAGGALVLTGAAPAGAAQTHQNCLVTDDQGNIVSITPSCSETVTYKGGVESNADMNPCTGDPGTFTINYRQNTFHANVNAAGDYWVTGTENGTVSFVPDNPAAPSGTGSMASWFNVNDNNRNGNTTYTFNVEVHTSDGHIVADHEVGHMNFDSSGNVTLVFGKQTLTCS